MKVSTGTLLAIATGAGFLLAWSYRDRSAPVFKTRGPRATGAAFASGERTAYDGAGGSRNAGPEAMKSREARWDKVAEASDESFPASDPPSYLPAAI